MREDVASRGHRTAVVVENLLDPVGHRAALLGDLRHGLTSSQKRVSPVWFYDDAGSELFDRITRLPEYYITRCEREILSACAPTIAARTTATTLVELGSGTSEKTTILLDALDGAGHLRRFVPFDVSGQTLRSAAAVLHRSYPRLSIHGIVGDFHHHLSAIPADGVRLVAFLGSTVGNLDPGQRRRSWPIWALSWAPPTGCSWGPTWSSTGGSSWPPTTTPPGPPSGSTRTCCSCSTASWGRTSTRVRSSTWPGGTPGDAGSRCACGRADGSG